MFKSGVCTVQYMLLLHLFWYKNQVFWMKPDKCKYYRSLTCTGVYRVPIFFSSKSTYSPCTAMHALEKSFLNLNWIKPIIIKLLCYSSYLPFLKGEMLICNNMLMRDISEQWILFIPVVFHKYTKYNTVRALTKWESLW